MKSRRREALLEIVRMGEVETQEQILAELRRRGFSCTQGTVSRDVRALGLVKVPAADGRPRYAPAPGPPGGDATRRARRAFEDYVVDIDWSGSWIFIKTLTGRAHAVAAAIDELGWPEVVGTVAGDDGILLLVRTRSRRAPAGPVREVLRRLEAFR